MWKHSNGVMDEAQSISVFARGRDIFLGFNYRFSLSERRSRGRGSGSGTWADTAQDTAAAPADITVLQVLVAATTAATFSLRIAQT